MRILKNINGLIKSAMAVALIGMLGFMTGCDGDDDPAAVVNTLTTLDLLTAGEWSVSGVTVDGNDFSSAYSGLALNFAEGSYSSTNGGAIFAPSGSWTFTSTTAEQMLLDGTLEVNIQDISETALVLGLVWNQTTIGTGGRSESVSGNHVFTFTK